MFEFIERALNHPRTIRFFAAITPGGAALAQRPDVPANFTNFVAEARVAMDDVKTRRFVKAKRTIAPAQVQASVTARQAETAAARAAEAAVEQQEVERKVAADEVVGPALTETLEVTAPKKAKKHKAVETVQIVEKTYLRDTKMTDAQFERFQERFFTPGNNGLMDLRADASSSSQSTEQREEATNRRTPKADNCHVEANKGNRKRHR